MDRDRELADEYTQMANLVERFEKRQALKLEGDWFLVETTSGMVIDCSILREDEVAWHKGRGYILTPVTIFRKT
jgi:hypothetical protein